MSLRSLSGIVGHELTWDEFFNQSVLLAMLYNHKPVQATGIRKHTWKVECPACHKIIAPLDSRRAIVWQIDCDCGNTFIATA